MIFETKSKYPFKIIISGEHTILYDQPAITCSINKYFETILTVNDSKIFKFEAYYENKKYIITKNKSKICNYVSNYLFLINEINKELNINLFENKINLIFNLRSDIPTSIGLGSSVSFAASFIKCLLDFCKFYFNVFFDDNILYNIVNRSENRIHGKASGIDMITILNKGVYYFKNKNNYKRINNKLNYNIIIVDSKIKKNTKKSIKKIKTNINKNIKYIKKIGDITKKIRKSIINDNDIKYLIKSNHYYLNKMDLYINKTYKIIQISEKYEFVGKLTGGGLGGCCIIFVNEYNKNVNKFLLELKENDFNYYYLNKN